MVSQPDSIKQMIADGTTFILEIQDSAFYKQINYNSPKYFDDNNHRVFLSILTELEKNMKWKLLEMYRHLTRYSQGTMPDGLAVRGGLCILLIPEKSSGFPQQNP